MQQREIIMIKKNSDITKLLLSFKLAKLGMPGWNQQMQAMLYKAKMIFFSLCVGLLGLTPAISMAEDSSVQQQLETLTRQLEQQQKMMQQQQLLIQQMQQQLDEQKASVHAKAQEIDQHIATEVQKGDAKAQEIDTHIATDEQKVHAKGEGDAQEALKEVKVVAKATGVDLSKEMFRYSGKGTTIKAPLADTQLTLGGFIRASFIHDFNAIESPYKFVAKDIVVNGQPSGVPNKRTTFTANSSRLFFSTATPLMRPFFHFRRGSLIRRRLLH